MLDEAVYERKQLNWLSERIQKLTDNVVTLKPSQWAELNRYLPASVTSMPGYYSFDIAPYLREIVDNFSMNSPIREVDVMKGVQICFTVGVLENIVGYAIGHIRSAPIMFLTADADIAKIRLEANITPMIQQSGLEEHITSSDETNTRKTGKTDKKISWKGGGYLLPFGAKSAGKLRSFSIQILLQDEIDAYPDKVGKDGDPCKLAEDRTAAYEQSRKILRGSTPLISQTSKIQHSYELGDKRKYMVPCKHCGQHQELSWTGTNEDGTVYGIVWQLDDKGDLISESVKYLCKFCQGEHINDDKAWMYRNNGEHCFWEPTKKAVHPHRRSYHINALYSPVGMQTWETQVRKWLEAWNTETNKPRDINLLQQFYNNVLGRPFKMMGEGLQMQKVILHRRPEYHQGEIPNLMVEKETGGKIQIVTCAVDVHKEHLDVLINGWAPGGRCYSIEWLIFEGNCEDLQEETWQKVRDLLENKFYIADDGRKYFIEMTLIDSQYNNDIVVRFCSEYQTSVFPIRGTEAGTKKGAIKEFSEFTTKSGTIGYNINNSLFKDRLANAFKQEWDGMSLQPTWYPNYPNEYPDKFFKELTVEHKVQKKHAITQQIMGWEWHRPNQADNHAWDLSVYNLAALEMAAVDICTRFLNEDQLNWPKFWEFCESEKMFFEEPEK
jgi:phage terminase large subunit GpA-like protein